MINNKKVKKILNNRQNKIIFGVLLLLFCLVLTVTFSINILSNEEVRSVEISSNGWETKEPGSWHITKSAEWTGYRTARVTFDVDTVIKTGEMKKDIILILDVSGSMAGDKLAKVKEDATELVETILSDEMNRVALIKFDTKAEILSTFTNDKETLLNQIEVLSASGTTNYADALRKTEEILEGYVRPSNKDLVALFLSDGYPCEETPNQIGEYASLKDNHPDLTVNAIQYEMGSSIIQQLIEISDNQYLAYVENLENVLFEAASSSQFYDYFVINDFINDEYFELGTVENVSVSIGEASFTIEDDLEKVTWDLGTDFRTGSKATITIDIKLKDGVEITDTSLFPTNKKEDITTKLPEEPEDIVKSDKTPKLKGAYKVIYDVNTPNGCSLTSPSPEIHPVYGTVAIRNDELVCSGYLFKGWEITDKSSNGIQKITDETFIMPEKDVYLKGTWTQVAISKSMIAEEYTVKYIMPFNGEEGYIDNAPSPYVTNSTGIKFGTAPSATNGQGLYVRAGTEEDEYPIFYYRGGVDSNSDGIEEALNNNVLFANKCWKIVRTTETGGTKLIYNGLPNESNANGICANTGTASQLTTTKAFNTTYTSPAYVGYMYGNVYTATSKTMTSTSSNSTNNTPIYRVSMANSTNYYFSKSYTLNGSTYTLTNPIQLGTWTSIYSTMAGEGYYTCKLTTTGTCTTLYYVLGGASSYAYTLALTGSKSLDQVNTNMVLGSTIIDNNDGTYTLSGTITTINKSDWYSNYASYKNLYICSDYVSTTCSTMYYLSATTNYSYTYYAVEKMVFGNDVEYVNGKYVLKDTYTKPASTPWSSFYNNSNITTRHYTCYTASDTCDGTVYYIYYTSSSPYHITLTGGKKIEDALDEMLINSTNEKDSTIKAYIDTWFAGDGSMTSYESYLEDAVWCNDRSIGTLGGWDKDKTNVSNYLYFGGYGTRNLTNSTILNPALKNSQACPNQNDRFTVSDTVNGNGKLTYKVGLITADEATIAGHGWNGYSKSSYLYTGQYYWTLSPSYFFNNYAFEFYVTSTGDLVDNYVSTARGVRPAISLNAGVTASSGDGSAANPYRVG